MRTRERTKRLFDAASILTVKNLKKDLWPYLYRSYHIYGAYSLYGECVLIILSQGGGGYQNLLRTCWRNTWNFPNSTYCCQTQVENYNFCVLMRWLLFVNNSVSRHHHFFAAILFRFRISYFIFDIDKLGTNRSLLLKKVSASSGPMNNQAEKYRNEGRRRLYYTVYFKSKY